MSASGFTPIQLYHSTTATTIPSSGNLANGELGLNIADMKLYAKNSSGVVTLLASNSSASATVSSVQVSGGTTGLTTSGGPITTSGIITFAGTLIAANGGTGFSSYTTGDMLFASGATAISKLSLGVTNYVLTAGASAPQYVAQSTLAAGSAINLAGGTAGASPYQTGSGATSFLSLGVAGYVLAAGASAPQYVAQNTLAAGSAGNITGGAANQVVFQSGASTTSFVTAPVTVGTVLSWTGSAFAWAAAPAATTTTNIAGGTQYQIPFQSGVSTTTFNANLTFDSATNTFGTTNITTTGAITAPSVGSIIRFYFSSTLPAAGPNHGAVAHLHSTGKLYYAHSSAWQIITSGLGTADTAGTVTPVGSAGQILTNDGAGGLTSNTTGTGVVTALGVNVGSSGAFVPQSGALTQYGVIYASSTTALATTAVGTATHVLTSNGSGVAPTFQVLPPLINISGGVAGAVPYQTAPSTTGFTAAGSAGQYLQSNGTSAPTWVTLAVSDNSLLYYFFS